MTKQEQLQFINKWLSELESLENNQIFMRGVKILLTNRKKDLLIKLGSSQ